MTGWLLITLDLKNYCVDSQQIMKFSLDEKKIKMALFLKKPPKNDGFSYLLSFKTLPPNNFQ